MISYVEEMNQFFWSLTIFVLFTNAFIYLSQSLKKEEKFDKLLMLGFTCIAFGLAFNQFFWYLKAIFIPLEGVISLLSFLSLMMGMTLFFFILERIMKKTKYIPSVINLILILLIVACHITSLCYDENIIRYVGYVFNATAFSSVLLWFSMKASKEFKIVSVFLFSGTLLYLAGAILRSTFIVKLIFTPLISFCFFIAGSILFVSPLFMKPQEASRVRIALISFTLISIVSLFIAIYLVIFFFLSYDVNLVFLITISIAIFGATITVIHFTLNAIKLRSPSERIDVEEELTARKEILSIFSRPERITEEEISISKEKRTCLVCKNELSREIYICPQCSALYCKNCSDALSNRENACWACNAPIDPSRPVKLPELAVDSKDDEKKGKKIALVTITDVDFHDKIERFKWDEEEKKEFIKSMLALSPSERMNILNEMMEMAEALEKGESYFEEDLS